LHGQGDVFRGQGLGALAVGQRVLQGWGLGGGDALAQVFAVLPDLVLEVGAGGAAALSGTVLGAERAVFHRVELGQLPQDLLALGVEGFHRRYYV